jgi:hypothetical protein
MIKKETKEKFVTIRVPESVLTQLQAICKSETRSVSAQILHYIKKGLVIKD